MCLPRGRRLLALPLLLVATTTPIAAQYPLSPSPVPPFRLFTPQPTFSGYVSVRETLRDDTASFLVNRARLTLQVLPIAYAAVRMQVDLSAVGRTRGDTVPAIVLTDAYIALAPPDTSSRVARALHPVLLIGQFRAPFSLEYLTSFSLLTTANRSQAVDRLAARRDLGLLGRVGFARFATLTGAIVNGEGPNRTSNSDGKQMAIGRLTVFPIPSLAISGKWLGHGAEHRWGYDARWIVRGLVVEGETIRRAGPTGAVSAPDGSGGYALAALWVSPWLQPVVKWERLREASPIATGAGDRQLTWTTYGINLSAAQGRLRFQLDWIAKSERPLAASDELVAQVQAIF